MRSSVSRRCLTLFALLVLSQLTGCTTRFVQDKPIVFEPAGAVEIDIESFGGDVRIHASKEKFSDIRVVARKEAVHGSWREDEARASLEEIDYEVEMVSGEMGPRLRIRTHTTHEEAHYQRVHLRITLPEAEHVTIRTRKGYVEARGITGRLDVRTSEKGVRVLTNRPMTRPVRIVTSGGDIDYRVRGESRGRFDAETIGGQIIRRVRYGQYVAEAGSSAHRMVGRLNDGENPVLLRTSHADIRIAVVDNPEQVGRLIVD